MNGYTTCFDVAVIKSELPFEFKVEPLSITKSVALYRILHLINPAQFMPIGIITIYGLTCLAVIATLSYHFLSTQWHLKSIYRDYKEQRKWVQVIVNSPTSKFMNFKDKQNVPTNKGLKLVDSKELGNWYKAFLQDAPNGYLSKTDLYMVYQQFFPFSDAIPFADHVFRLLDVNRNGRIEYVEFIKALSTLSRGTLDEKIEMSFRLYDVDGDGYVSKDDMRMIIDAVHKMVSDIIRNSQRDETVSGRITRLFTEMDKDGDNKLSYDEFKTGAREDPSILQAISIYDGLL
ncbi:EF-hand [Rozella allomycis CSF55]|uniref:Calcium-binding protein NCS-1 n=1 Tax=Rozella allomycis (strain CSF55) TaxID=988480 RepID=A0A075AZ88_ROZAC|nr:EF-hand-like domain-containing protein [Rozella allomycis CSF55]RKP19549.1 EF-hand [Rozella allomycis CSF55]|eukprot:EPZ35459.1 EF-hand-like domain-containing protein [Rozella allomycis CSF55]